MHPEIIAAAKEFDLPKELWGKLDLRVADFAQRSLRLLRADDPWWKETSRREAKWMKVWHNLG